MKRLKQRSNVSWERVAFYERLSYLLGAHISLTQALRIMNEDEILRECEKGRTLNEILKERNVAQAIVSRIRQGEKTGTLSQACDAIARALYFQKEIHSKMMMALLYPVVLLCATGGIIIFLVMYIFPKMMPLFLGMHVQLPITTRTVLWTSKYLSLYWWIIMIVLALFIFAVFRYKDTFEWIVLRTPLISSWYCAQKITQHFARIGSYIESGIGLEIACRECADMENSYVFKKSLERIADDIVRGIAFSSALQKEFVYPKEIHSMIMIGESSGQLSSMCQKISSLYERAFSLKTKAITSSIEPLSMLIMGMIVGFVALSMITPLYSITEHVR